MYPVTKHLHELCAAASIALFVLRGVWMLAASPQLAQRWVKILPHVVDTVLLASAAALTLMLHQYPLTQAWLTAKLLALIVYIGLGLVALRFGRSRGVRAAAWGAAILTFIYIVSVALSHDPRGFLSFIV